VGCAWPEGDPNGWIEDELPEESKAATRGNRRELPDAESVRRWRHEPRDERWSAQWWPEALWPETRKGASRVSPEERQYVEHVARQREVAGWIEAEEEWGYAPTLATRRDGITEARSLEAGDRVRIRAQGCPPGFATVRRVTLDPGCPWNRAYPSRVWALLDGPDGLVRLLRVAPDVLVES
jgi:hypothetical protein